MNSDPSPTGPTPGNTPSASTRTSNLKSRWKRGPSPGVPPQRPAASASCGIVTDIASVRETISGQHAKGYVEPERPVAAMPPPAREPAPAPKPTPPAPRPEMPRTESPRPPAPAQAREVPPPSTPAREPAPSHHRREAPPPRPQSDGRSNQRDQYVALKPDPANDPAPRRLRTETSKPVPVEEYAPSAFATRPPDKTVPLKSNREESREHNRRHDSARPAPVKAHASIPLNPPRSKEGEKPKAQAKSGGIVGFIKRIFSGGEPAAKVEEKAPAREESNDERRSGRDGERHRGRGGDDRRQHQRHRHGGHHHARGQDDRREGRDERRSRSDRS